MCPGGANGSGGPIIGSVGSCAPATPRALTTLPMGPGTQPMGSGYGGTP